MGKSMEYSNLKFFRNLAQNACIQRITEAKQVLLMSTLYVGKKRREDRLQLKACIYKVLESTIHLKRH